MVEVDRRHLQNGVRPKESGKRRGCKTSLNDLDREGYLDRKIVRVSDGFFDKEKKGERSEEKETKQMFKSNAKA